MKQNLALALLLSLVVYAAMGQGSPSGISYQAIARDGSGNELSNTSMNVIFTIHQGAIDGNIVFEETHSTLTNTFGLFTLVIGQGIPTGNGSEASLDDIDWASFTHFLRVQVDIPDSTTQWLLGVTQLLTVPYAFHATTAEFYEEGDSDPSNETITNVELNGTSLSISEAGNNFDIDLSAIAGDDADADPANETISTFSLNGTDLTIVEGGTDHSTSLSELEDGWDTTPTTTYTDYQVGIGTPLPSSTLDISGSVSYAITTISYPGSYALNSSHHVVICNVDAGGIILYLPPADSCAGRVYTIKRFASSLLNYDDSVLVLPDPADLIDGNPQYDMGLVFEQFVTVISDGDNWWIINQYQED